MKRIWLLIGLMQLPAVVGAIRESLKRVISVLILLCFVLPSTAHIHAQTSDPLRVVATTTLIADVAQNVGGNLVEVTALIPTSGDSHTYTPTPRDVTRVADADIILVNGLFLEESLLETLEANASVEPVVVSMGVRVLGSDEHGDSETIGVLGEDTGCGEDDHEDEASGDEDTHEHGPCDPHVWMDPANVIIWTNNIAEAFAQADPASEDTYLRNADAYIEQLETLQAELEELAATVPESERVLVTNHRFLAYFAAAFDFEIATTIIPGVSTIAEVDPRTLAERVNIVEQTGAPAIFAEMTSNTELAETVAAEVDHDVQIVTLYSASLSDEDGPASTYIDYMRHNVETIVTALTDGE